VDDRSVQTCQPASIPIRILTVPRILLRRASASCFALLFIFLLCSTSLLAQTVTDSGKRLNEKPDAPNSEYNQDQEWEDEEVTGRSFLFKELVLSGFYSSRGISGIPPGDPGQDNFEISPRPPGNYLGIDYVWTPGSSPLNKSLLPGWFQLRAINLHPRLLFSRMEERGGMSRIKFAPQDFWVRFSLAGSDRLTLRIGQFALPYGVNPILAPRQRFLLPIEATDLGLKWDWGVQIKGPAGQFDWELAATLGSGEVLRSPHLFSRTDSTRFLFTGRIGAPTYWDLQYGVSFLYGYLPMIRGAQIFKRNATQRPTSTSRWRISFDSLYRRDTYLIAGAQVTYGQDGFRGDKHLVDISRARIAHVLSYRLWLDWVVPKHLDVRLSAQLDNVTRDRFTPNTSDTALTLEAVYSLTTSISAMMDHRIELRKSRGTRASATYLTLVYYGN
jgi:hypothetical protein